MKWKWQVWTVCFLSLVLLLATGTPGSAASMDPLPGPGLSAPQYLQPWAEWCVKPPAGHANVVDVFITSNSGLNNGVTYTTGTLTFDPATGRFAGTCKQYFNNRLTPDKAPFDPAQTDDVLVELHQSTGQLALTLLEQGNLRVTFNLQCANNLLYAVDGRSDATWQSVVVSLKKNTLKKATLIKPLNKTAP